MKDKLRKIELIDKYLRGELSKPEMEQVKEMLAIESDLKELFNTLTSMKTDLDSGALTSLAEPLKKLSQGMFRQFKKSVKQNDGKNGLTIFDSQVFPLPEGVRPAVTSVRRLKYKFNSTEMELSLYPISLYSYEIIGRLNHESSDKYIIEIRGENYREKTTTDELGMFIFCKVPAMNYKIRIQSGKETLFQVELDI